MECQGGDCARGQGGGPIHLGLYGISKLSVDRYALQALFCVINENNCYLKLTDKLMERKILTYRLGSL